MTKKYTKEVHGLLKNGDRIFLGTSQVTLKDAIDWLEGWPKGDVFSVGLSVYKTGDFMGVQIELFKEYEIE